MQIYKKNIELVEQIVDGELVVLDQESGQIHQFNTTASEIWKYLDGQTSTEAIVQQISEQYDIDLNIVQKDVETILQQLLKNNLIEP